MRFRIKDFTFLENKKLLLCVSGGMDSIFLYHNIIENKLKYNFKVGLAHVNYNTSSNSNHSMNLCRKLSLSNNHPFYLKVSNKIFKSNFEHLAREFRYSFFDSIKKAEKYDYILTAHNKNDLIETLYMQRKIDDFSILPYSESGKIFLRPLINIDRDTIREYVVNNKCLYYEDPTNLDPKYRRNHLRINIFPKLKDRDDLFKKLLNTYKLKSKKYNQTRLDVENNKNKFIKYDSSLNAIRINVDYAKSLSVYSFKLIFQGAIDRKFNLRVNKTKRYWKEFYRQIMISNKKILFNFHSSLSVFSDSSYIYVSPIKKNGYSKKIINKLAWGNGKFLISEFKKNQDKNLNLNNKNIFLCSKEDYDKGLFVRRWFNGDKILTSNSQSKLISDLFNDYKIFPFMKNMQPIIVQDDEIQWVPGIAICRNNHLSKKNIIKIEWIEGEK